MSVTILPNLIKICQLVQKLLGGKVDIQTYTWPWQYLKPACLYKIRRGKQSSRFNEFWNLRFLCTSIYNQNIKSPDCYMNSKENSANTVMILTSYRNKIGMDM
jgi:hypothetical protein